MKTEIHERCLKENEKLCSLNELLYDFPEAHDFIKKYGKKIILTKNNDIYTIRLYSEKYEYIANFLKHDEGKYCSCYCNCRVIRPMESWNRGNDFSDGHDIKHVLELFEQEMLENELISFGDVVVRKQETHQETPINPRSKWTVPQHHSFTVEESPITHINKVLEKFFELDGNK